jgi:hypothetical protein
VLYLALSCLQGRLGTEALTELLSLNPDGIQLTPGNVINDEFEHMLNQNCVPVRTHNGFSWKAMRKRVWNEDGTLNGYWDSVHAPGYKDIPRFWSYTQSSAVQPAWEIMYPAGKNNCFLSTWSDLKYAMQLGLELAVDISHLDIIRDCYGINSGVLNQLLNYHNIKEVHVSQAHNGKDVHRPITGDTWHLEWAQERLASGTPVVLECYMHRLTQDERKRQVDLLRQ